MRSSINIEYVDGRLSDDFGVINRHRDSGNVIAFHYPEKKYVVWTEINGRIAGVSEYTGFKLAHTHYVGRVRYARIVAGGDA